MGIVISCRISSKLGRPQQMLDVRLLAGEEIVQADHVVTVIDQSFAEVGAEETGAAGHEDSLDFGHFCSTLIGWGGQRAICQQRGSGAEPIIATREQKTGLSDFFQRVSPGTVNCSSYRRGILKG